MPSPRSCDYGVWEEPAPDRKMRGKTSLQGAKSGAGEEFLVLDCKAAARMKGMLLFADTGIVAHHLFSLGCF